MRFLFQEFLKKIFEICCFGVRVAMLDQCLLASQHTIKGVSAQNFALPRESDFNFLCLASRDIRRQKVFYVAGKKVLHFIRSLLDKGKSQKLLGGSCAIDSLQSASYKVAGKGLRRSPSWNVR